MGVNALFSNERAGSCLALKAGLDRDSAYDIDSDMDFGLFIDGHHHYHPRGPIIMMNKIRTMRGLSAFCAALMLFFSIQPAVYADLVSTAELQAEVQAKLDRSALMASLQRQDVQAALTMQGVQPEQAMERVAAMTDQEIAQLSSQINDLPAGGDVLGTVLLVLIILVFTDLAGWTNVYPKI